MLAPYGRLQPFGRGGIGSVVRDLMGRRRPRTVPRRKHAHAVLFGALLYRVIYADRIVQAEEVPSARSPRGEFSFAAEDRLRAARIQQRTAEDIDRQRLCRIQPTRPPK
jgi:hypothetical protein